MMGSRAFIVGRIRHRSVFIISEGGRGVFDRIVGYVIFGKPCLCSGMEGGNLLRTPVSIQLVLQQLPKKMVKSEPSIFSIKSYQEEKKGSDL